MLFDPHDEEESVSYWPSAADLFMTLFIISIAAIAAVMVAFLPTSDFSDQEAINNAVGTDMAKIRKPVGELRTTVDLPPISTAAPPAVVIAKLDETCKVAIERITLLSSGDLSEQIFKLQNELLKLKQQNKELEERNKMLTEQLDGSEDYSKLVSKLKSEIENLQNINIQHEAKIHELITQLNDKPPIINLTGKKGENEPDAPLAIVFQSGKATLKSEFTETLHQNIFPDVGQLLKKYKSIDTLEIVGHTDGSKVSTRSNLDESIASHFAGSNNFSSMTPGSNCDLGLMRALAIRQAWNQWLDEQDELSHLKKIDVRCYSAAQTVPPADSKAATSPSFRSHWLESNQDARRIEIRFTQLKNSAKKEQP